MPIDYKIWDFPSFPISEQLFYVPGSAYELGYTSGGIRQMSPEPGGRAMLDIRPALQTNEWDYPLSSWLMSKTNGEIFRVRLAPTPQIASGRVKGTPWGSESIYPDSPWSNLQNWSGDLNAIYSNVSSEGSTVVRINMSSIGPLLRHGHVIGHKDNAYIVDDIVYSNSGEATVTIKPPLRHQIAVGDIVYFRPYFVGTIANGESMRTAYRSSENGAIQINSITLIEVLI